MASNQPAWQRFDVPANNDLSHITLTNGQLPGNTLDAFPPHEATSALVRCGAQADQATHCPAVPTTSRLPQYIYGYKDTM
jgi:hypothetical protein